MLIEETKILFNNLKKKIGFINEAVGESGIVKAINTYEYIYIYYEGDNTIKKGYRTIRPFVLGSHKKSGNVVLRAWQDRGTSDSFKWPHRRKDHEYHTDTDGKTKVGWRLFRLDKITSVYPTGRRFVDKDDKVMIPPLYNQKDKDMSSIVASITPITTPAFTKDTDTIEKPDVVAKKVDMDKSAFKAQTGRYKQFYNVGRHKKDPTSDDIEKLYNIAKKVMKKSPNRYIVALNNRGELKLVDVKQREKLPPESIVGDLSTLYSQFVLSKKTPPPTDDFFKKEMDKLNDDIAY